MMVSRGLRGRLIEAYFAEVQTSLKYKWRNEINLEQTELEKVSTCKDV